MRTFSPLSIFALLCLLAIGPATPQGSDRAPGEIGKLYLGNGLTLIAVKPALLTQNAGVSQFAYSPAGTRIGFATSEQVGDKLETSVGVATAKPGGSITTYVQASTAYYVGDTQPGDTGTVNGLCGWSDDGAYLAFSISHFHPVSVTGAPNVADEIDYIDLVHGTVKTVSIPPEAWTPPATAAAPNGGGATSSEATAATDAIMAQPAWAPGERALAYIVIAGYPGDLRTSTLCVYDPASGEAHALVHNDGFLIFRGWLDGNRLLYQAGKERAVYDLSAGKSEPAPNSPAGVARPPFGFGGATEVMVNGSRTIAVSDDQRPIDAGAQSFGQTTAVWVTRQGGPRLLDRILIDSFRSSPSADVGVDSSPEFAPSGGFDRQGRYQVAYIAEGDLKIVDLTVRQATNLEIAAGGDKLPCDLERQVALANAKQIGVAMEQYVEDYDEHFPPTANFSGGIQPYLSENFPIDLPGIADFEYLQPGDLSLADAQSPADTPVGRYVLPCAVVTLYMDGHVQAQDRVPGS